MKRRHPRRLATLASSVALLALVATPVVAQLDTLNLPSPPTQRLAALRPFFGTFRHTDQKYADLGGWNGTVTVGPAIKGWYVQIVVDTRTGPIDRELRLLLTWDEGLARYRVWGFDTMPPAAPGTVEGTGWLEGDELLLQWRDVIGPDGRHHGIIRDRFRLRGPDELVIDVDVTPDWDDPIHLGTWVNRRVTRPQSP